MAFEARMMVFEKRPRGEAGVVFDEATGSYCLRLSGDKREDWTDSEVAEAKAASVALDCRVALIYVECFGGACDHWARIYASGREMKQFEEHADLREILSEVGVSVPEGGYYAPLNRGG